MTWEKGDIAIYFPPSHSLNRKSVTIDALSNRTTTLFDAAGNVTQVTDARGNNTQFLYDTLGRQSVTIDALSNRTTTLFDAGEEKGTQLFSRTAASLAARAKLPFGSI
jgi:YD repeat-containing protein